ncbi:MAG: TolC family protein [Cyclobacteriaceae bacterium]
MKSILLSALFGVSYFFGQSALAQEQLTFEEALTQTLANNYQIKVARLDLEVAANNALRLNNGYLPSVSANGNYGWSYAGGSFETVQGENEFDPNASYNYGAGIDIDYTLWDGQGRKYTYLQNRELRELSALQVRQLIENTIVELSNVYYNATLQENTLESLQDAIEISVDRVERAKYAYEYGVGTQLDILNARVDLNTDSVNLLNTRQQLNNALRNLNLVMGIEINKKYSLSDNIEINRQLDQEEMLELARKRNVQIASIEKNLLVQEYAIEGSKAALLPSFSANIGYDYRGSRDPNGAFVLGSTNSGPNASVALNWNIFNGQNRVRIRNATLSRESLEVQKEDIRRQVEFNLLNAFEAYRTAIFILDSQRSNVETAQRNFERTKELLKLAQITSIEFRQAQLNLLNAEIQLSQSKINAKNAELQVLALAGQIAG